MLTEKGGQEVKQRGEERSWFSNSTLNIHNWSLEEGEQKLQMEIYCN